MRIFVFSKKTNIKAGKVTWQIGAHGYTFPLQEEILLKHKIIMIEDNLSQSGNAKVWRLRVHASLQKMLQSLDASFMGDVSI